MATTPEGAVKAKIKQLLTKYNTWYFLPVSGGFGVHGIPDFVGCYNGLCFGIEAKAKGKSASALQLRQKTLMEAAGAKWFLVDSIESLWEVELWLNGIGIASTT